MKKIFFFLLSIHFFLSAHGAALQPVLKISNYGDYISTDTLKNFSKKYDIHVIYETHDTNEIIRTKLEKGNKDGYDLVILSADTAGSLIKKGVFSPIDKKSLPGLKNLYKQHLNPPFDPENTYSVPYFWGTIGIAVNMSKTGDISKWADLWDKRYKNGILLSNEPFDIFAMVLKSLGYSMNTENPDEIEHAYKKLTELLPNAVMVKYGNTANLFIGQRFYAGMVFNGDASVILNNRSDFAYIYPKDGAIRWMDSLLIPKNAANKEAAHLFINYILQPDVAAPLAQAIGYGLPNFKAFSILPEDLRKNRVFYPDEADLKNSEVLSAADKVYRLKLYYWNKFLKAYEKEKGKL